MYDALNPKFIFFSPVTGQLTERTLAEHVDHAIIALDARAPLGGQCDLEMIGKPAAATSTLRIDLWVNDLSDYTCTYGFLISSEDGRTPIARGERCVASIDPASHRPSKWSHDFLAAHQELLKDLPAYA